MNLNASLLDRAGLDKVRVGKLIDFLYRIGSVKNKADSWKDLFFPEAHELPGS